MFTDGTIRAMRMSFLVPSLYPSSSAVLTPPLLSSLPSLPSLF